MDQRRFLSSALIAVFLFLSVCISAKAEDEVIISPAPTPKETIVIPPGYLNCFTVSAGWYQNTWYPEHKVCQYDATKNVTAIQGDAWIDGYWYCTKSSKGNCTKWEWKPGHWVKTFTAY
jgi:hypothetical protein